ncbi:MAG: hypothetical protein R2851_20710 [Caldilineaceae bacterium]
MTTLLIHSNHPPSGRARIQDKSISHRAVMFASIAEGESRIHNFLTADCRATVQVMRQLGVQIDVVTPTELVVHGRGVDGLVEPTDFLDCDNSAPPSAS